MDKHLAEIHTPEMAATSSQVPTLVVLYYNAFIPDASASTRPRATSFTLSTSPDDLLNTHSAPQLKSETIYPIDDAPFRLEKNFLDLLVRFPTQIPTLQHNV